MILAESLGYVLDSPVDDSAVQCKRCRVNCIRVNLSCHHCFCVQCAKNMLRDGLCVCWRCGQPIVGGNLIYL